MAGFGAAGGAHEALDPERISAPGRPDRGNPQQHGLVLQVDCIDAGQACAYLHLQLHRFALLTRGAQNRCRIPPFKSWGTCGNQSPFSCAGLMRSASIGMLAVPSFPRIPELPMGVTARELEADHSLDNGLAARLACRRGALRSSTAGVAPGYVQGNLAVLPKDLAADFLRFCQANPKPCPLIGVSDPGNPKVPSLGLDLDIRTDLPGYRVWRDGELVEETADVRAHWRDDLVAFVIGCSYSFEEALIEDGIPLRHI